MNDWRSKTGKHAERVRQEAERARQASMEVYRKALKSIRTRAPGWRAKLPSDRVGRMRVGLIALAVFLALVVSGSGVVAGMALAFNRRLPDVSSLYSPPDEATRIYGANNELIASLYRENRASVPLDGIPKELRQAVIAVEDDRFYQHHGVDFRGTLRAVLHNLLAGEVVEGGSTITQQLARNMFLTQRRLVSRKLAEMMLALEIERRLTKDEILERYLNQVYFGNGAYGVEMAARVYYGKSAGDLNLAESSMLAGIIRSPSVATPFQNLELAKERERTVLRRMADLGYITPKQADGAAVQSIKLSQEGNAGLIGIRAPYFVSYILPYLLERYGEDLVYNGGLRVYTTLDPKMQAAAEKAIRAGIDQAQKDKLEVTQGAMMMREALEQSINIPAIKTINEVGPQAVVDYAKRMGITSALQPNLSLALGTNDVTLMEMASAFGTLATLGVHADPIAILRVTDREGRVLEERTSRRTLALGADIAYMMTDLLKGVILRGTGTAANIGRPAAGKTGTTDDYHNAWFIGFTPYLTTAVWVGNDDNTPMNRVVGGTVPARIWGAYMKVAVQDTPPEDWQRPDGVVNATVCGTSGMLATSRCSNPRTEVFLRGTEPTEFDVSTPSTPPPDGTSTVVVSIPLSITAPAQGQVVSSPFMIEGATDPNATVSLSVIVQGSFMKINVAETRVPVTNDGHFSYLFRPALHVSGVQYVITVTATSSGGGRASTTLIVKEQ